MSRPGSLAGGIVKRLWHMSLSLAVLPAGTLADAAASAVIAPEFADLDGAEANGRLAANLPQAFPPLNPSILMIETPRSSIVDTAGRFIVIP